MKKIFLISLLTAGSVFATPFTIIRDGVFFAPEQVDLSAGSYVVLGDYEFVGIDDAGFTLGLALYDKFGNKLHGDDDFSLPHEPEDGFWNLGYFDLNETSKNSFALPLILTDENISKVNFVVETYMGEGAILSLNNLEIVSEIEYNLSIDGAFGLRSNFNKSSTASGANSDTLSLQNLLESALDGSFLNEPQSGISLVSTGSVTVYLNALTGVDTKDGLSAANAKKTMISALSVSGVESVILEKNTTAFSVGLIKPASGTTVRLKPSGVVTINGLRQ